MKKHKDYFMLPNKIFDLELKPRDFIVYSCLVRHKDNEEKSMVSIFEKSKHLCPFEKQAGESPTPIWGDGRFTSAGNADC